MSGSEFDAPVVEAKSKIKVVRNAKGEPQWEISVIAGETDDVLDKMRGQAVAQHKALEREIAS